MNDGETLATVLGLVFTGIVISVFIAVFIVIGKKSREQKTQEEYAKRYREKMASAKLNQQKSQRDRDEIKSEQYKHQLHQKDAHEHEHLGEEEHYEEIVGSLGEVNDEGCEDLGGVRFIAHDIAYEIVENDNQDYAKIARAMVLGDVLNNPRFKRPYSRK